MMSKEPSKDELIKESVEFDAETDRKLEVIQEQAETPKLKTFRIRTNVDLTYVVEAEDEDSALDMVHSDDIEPYEENVISDDVEEVE